MATHNTKVNNSTLRLSFLYLESIHVTFIRSPYIWYKYPLSQFVTFHLSTVFYLK